MPGRALPGDPHSPMTPSSIAEIPSAEEVFAKEETLDPDDWMPLRALSHAVVDEAVFYLRDIREKPVWREMPAEVRDFYRDPLPREPMLAADIYRQLSRNLMPYPMGNIHPRFWAWYMGAGNFTGALGDFLAAILGSNVGGGSHAAAEMDQQVVRWCKEMTGFPADASGTLVSGGSMANLIGLTVARNAKAGIDVREEGVAAMPRPLRFYASDQVHSCHRKAMETLGLGNKALRRIATDDALRIDLVALRQAIAADRDAGLEPACIIATAGTVNSGAIDDLTALAYIAAEENLWLHVDGCIGALIALAPRHHHLVAGLARADSLALDPHKWLHAPFEVGCALVRDAKRHHRTFAVTPEYLESSARGLASGEWLHEYGLQTSRGFRALKVWMALKEHGADKFGRLIDQNIDQARYLSSLIAAEPQLELVAPTTINIVCFRFHPGALGEQETGDQAISGDAMRALNNEILLRLQESGIATLSDTTIKGEYCLRVAITNHRTRRSDLDLLVQETLRIGRELLAGGIETLF